MSEYQPPGDEDVMPSGATLSEVAPFSTSGFNHKPEQTAVQPPRFFEENVNPAPQPDAQPKEEQV